MWTTRIHDFLNYLRFEKRYSAHTILAYQADLDQFRQFLDSNYQELSDTRDIRHYHIRSWLAGLKEKDDATATTLNRKRSSLNSFYKYLMRHGLADANPARQLHAQRRPERLPTVIRPEEAEKLVEETQFSEGFRGATEQLICELLYAAGLRRAELVELKESDVEWSLQQLRVVGKGNKERLLPVSPVLLDALREYIKRKKEIPNADRHRLLILSSGAPIYPGYVYRTVRQYLETVTTQRKKSPHVLRHSFATHLLSNGANIQAIKDLLGHSSLAATQVYTHNSIDQLKDVHRRRHPRG